MKKNFLIVLLFILVNCNYLLSNTIIVDIEGLGDYTSIQEGINNSVDGDTVLVHPGIYVENINYNGENIVLGSLLLATHDTTYIYQTIIDGNHDWGVAIFENGEDSLAILSGFTITNGFCDASGCPTYIAGGITCKNFSNPTLTNLWIHNNNGLAYYGFGGVILCYENSSPRIENVIISENIANTGGGIICGVNSNPRLLNVSIVNNLAQYNGGGIFCANNAHIILTNSILWNNFPEEIYFYSDYEPYSITITYSDVKNGIEGIVTNNNGTVNWLEGNIEEDPLFVGGDPFSYELSTGSPCIDAGTIDTTGLHLPEYDLAGNTRIYNGIIDIGAYEWQGQGIDEPDTSFIHNLYLFNNSPNPFKESTTISFISADYERIKDYTLSIYNTKGQLVKRYYGSKDDFWVRTEIVWDGRDESGKQVAPGTYLYKLEYNGNAVVRKMVLLR